MKEELSGVGPTVVEIDFAQLPDGSLVEMVESPQDPASSLLAVYRNGAVEYVDRLQDGNRILMPLPRTERQLKYVCLPRGAERFNGFMDLFADVGSFFTSCTDVPHESLVLMTAYVLSSWFPEKLPFSPYLALVGPPGSGKTTALRVLGILCRRSLLTADITSAAFYSVCNRISPTILIDETLTAGNARTLHHLLRSTSSRGFVSLRKGNAQLAHGPKVLSWVELPNDPQLCSRCVILPMHKTTRTDLCSPDDPSVLWYAEKVRMRLLQFRFERFSSLSVSKIPAAAGLSSRPLDIYRALALPVADEPEFCNALASLISAQRRFQPQLLPPVQASTLRLLYEFIHEKPKCDAVRIQGLAAAVNGDLASRGESSAVSERKIGYVLTSLGLTNRTRQNTGYVLWIDRSVRQRIHRMVRDYEVDAVTKTGCDVCVETSFASTDNGAKEIPLGSKMTADEAKSERCERRERQPQVQTVPGVVAGSPIRQTAKPNGGHAEPDDVSRAVAASRHFPRKGARSRIREIGEFRVPSTLVRRLGKSRAGKASDLNRIQHRSAKSK